jgi:sensor histidine kinase YesM
MDGQRKSIDISVRFEQKDAQLVCSIEDNGVGIYKSKQLKKSSRTGHQSVGISNIQRRIELLNQKHQLQGKLHVEDLGQTSHDQRSGTRITLTLPLETKNL